MKNNFLKIVIYIFISFFVLNLQTFASQEKVQDVFWDISNDYKYLQELQSLYDKWMISPDENWNFSPNALLTRWEFTWIAMQSICRQCISPNTPEELTTKYSWTQPFFDVLNNNKYFYCIADAKDNNYVVWYNKWYVCEDWTTKNSESPFCINNKITLEEAVAVLLRNSWIFTIQDNEQTISQIQNWIITENISKDVWVKNIDWSVYTFYWYLKKALEYTFVEYDIFWNKKEYKMLQTDSSWNINPKKNITKEEFLKLAYITTKANSCSTKLYNTNLNTFQNQQPQTTPVQMFVYESQCKAWDSDYQKLNWAKWTYCFKWDSTTSSWYSWAFENKSSWQTFNQNWKTVSWVSFPSNWVWQVTLKVDSWTSIFNILINDSSNNNSSSNSNNSWLSLLINATPISWYWPLQVSFVSIVWGWDWNYKYSWNFWDWTNSTEASPKKIFQNTWSYKVELTATDWNWKTGTSSLIIEVLEWVACSASCSCENWFICSSKDKNQCSVSWVCQKDTDSDWVSDINDKCPTLDWVAENNWCPIFDKPCVSWKCDNWYFCNTSWYCEASKEDTSLCVVPSTSSSIYWNLVCNSCPCAYELKFLANLRKCDVVFPAIISPDAKTIYSRWETFQIPYK